MVGMIRSTATPAHRDLARERSSSEWSPHQFALESVLDCCDVQIEGMPDSCRDGSAHKRESGAIRCHFHLVGKDEPLQLMLPQQTSHLQGGDLVIVLKNTPHMLAATPRCCPEAAEGNFISTLYGKFELPKAGAAKFMQILPDCLVLTHDQCSESLRALSTLLITTTQKLVPGWQVVANKLASSLLALAVCEYVSQTDAPLSNLPGLRDARIARVLGAIHQRLDKEWTIRSLATIAGMTRSTFVSQFSTVVGIPPMRYVRFRKVSEAKDLLQNHSLSVATVAEKLGYSSESAFRKLFKRVEGVGPGRVRAAVRFSSPNTRV